MIRVGLTPCQIKEFSQTCRKIGTLSKTSTLIAPSNSDHWSQLEWLNLAKQALLTYQLVDSEWALSQAKQCPGADPSMFRQLELEVVLYIKQRRGNLAMHTCTQMLQHYPRFAADPVGVSNLGAVLSLNKDFRHAQELLEQVPRDHPVWLDQAAAWLAETYVSLGKSHVAESIMEEVCKKYDSFKDREFETETRSNLQSSDDYSRTAWLCISVKNRQLWGGILLQNNKIDDAIEVLECTSQKAFRFLGDGNVIAHNVHNMLGLAYGFAKKYEKAVECLIPSLNWLQGYLEFPDRNLVNGWKVTAMYLHQMARNQEALEASRHAQRICRRLLENRRATGIDVQTQSELEIEITKTNIAVARAHIKLQQYQEALQILSTLQTTGATASKLDKEIYLMQAIVQHALSRVQK